ncbi:4Fe-4S dicluster domain-containing protein [Chloroflexota bacterium]
MSETEQKLRSEAGALLEKGRADYIIGYETGSLKFATTPLITRGKDDIDRLVINPFITNNLSVFLRDICGKAGIVAKGCDSRSIVSLIQDRQVAREDVFIIGIPCSGVIDVNKIEKLTGKDRDELDDISWQGDKAIVTAGGSKKDFPAREVLMDDCLSCETPVPPEYDILLDEAGPPVCDQELSRSRIKELEDMPPEKRWEFWKDEFSRCIRCYACRQVCPACFCERCFVEESEPPWISPLPQWQDNLIFQAVRMIHVAGRCVDCGECQRACPVNIPLRSLSQKMAEIVEELFHYQAGTDKEAPPLMASYETEEAEDFIR